MNIFDPFSSLESAACFICEVYVGIFLLRFIVKFINGIKIYFCAHTLDFKKMGSWAVVTGGTNGIGKGYALELARLGLNVCIISRSQENLDEVASEIECACSVEVKTIQADFSQGNKIYENISQELKNLNIGVLVNNVGISYPHAEYFLDIEDGDKVIDNLIRINITALNKMTRIVLPQMLKRKCGVIINISSATGTFPVPLLAAYSGSKAYVDFFSRSLSEEYKSQGIRIQVVYPWFVSTNMTHNMKTNFLIPDGVTFAKSALATVGVSDHCYGYWKHAVQAWIISLLPAAIFESYLLKTMHQIRKMALKRKKKSK